MGWFDKSDDRRGQATITDEQAIERYCYMLRTAPPEAIERAHQEAFAQLTPEQRRAVLEQLAEAAPQEERRYAADDPQSLARLATRTELRRPGMLERLLGGNRGGGYAGGGMGFGGGMGIGGMVAGSLLASLAGSFIGTSIAQNFFNEHPFDSSALGDPANFSESYGEEAGALDDTGGAVDDLGSTSDLDAGLDSDFGAGFDDGGFDV